MRKERGFTLIELLIVVAIIGIIAAIAIPNLLNAIHRGRQKRTMADMRTVATAIGRMEPIVEEFALPLHDKLGPKGACGQHLSPPPQGRGKRRESLALARLCGVRSRLASQESQIH